MNIISEISSSHIVRSPPTPYLQSIQIIPFFLRQQLKEQEEKVDFDHLKEINNVIWLIGREIG